MKTNGRIISFILAAVLVLSCAAVPAFAVTKSELNKKINIKERQLEEGRKQFEAEADAINKSVEETRKKLEEETDELVKFLVDASEKTEKNGEDRV